MLADEPMGTRPAIVLLLLLALSAPAAAQSLGGSAASLDRQNRAARKHDFSYLGQSSDVKRFVRLGLLVPVRGNADYELAAVSFPYARDEVRLFVERLAQQYRSACGEKLVVTSLTRPQSRQPRNASSRSVHPTGMAVDLRASTNRRCRSWLERTLLSLEKSGLLEATRERRPPHYHVAVYPRPYRQYVDVRIRRQAGATRLASASGAAATASDSGDGSSPIYRVDRGDTLWGIAKQVGVTVEDLQEANGLAGPRIYAGQLLTLPRER